MPEPALRRWSVQEFFAWQERQDERYELVGGVPVQMMAGARNVHDDIVVNLVAEFRTRLRGTPCRPFTGDGSVETLPGQIRRPDLGIDCGARDPTGLTAAEPRQRRIVAGLDRTIELPEFGMTLALADVYDGVAFPPRPRLASGT
jgi:Uma2 family endonuclease